MQLTQPPINALCTINIEHVIAPEQLTLGVPHYKPHYSYLIALHRTALGVVAQSTSEKTSTEQLTEHVRQVEKESGIVAAMNSAFEWLEEQTRPR